MSIYDLAYEEDHAELFKVLVNPKAVIDPTKNDLNTSNLLKDLLIACCCYKNYYCLMLQVIKFNLHAI